MVGTTTFPEHALAGSDYYPDNVALSVRALRKNGIFVGEAKGRKDEIAISAFKQLRTQVITELDALGVRTVLVTGPTSGVGKTAISVNLAYSIAKLPNQKAIAIDLDLRGSTLQSTLGITSDYGSERIGDSDFSFIRASHYLGSEKLLILPAARHISDSSELLMSENAKQNLALLSTYQDACYVIYDAPPVLGCDDIAALIPNMDAAIMVVEEGVTSRRELSESMRVLGKLPVITTVLNKSNDKKIQQYYY